MESVRWAFNCGKWLPTRAEWTLAARCIQSEEKERIGRYVFQKDAKCAIVGRLLLRKLLCEEVGMPYDSVQLTRTDKGKPCLSQKLPNPCSELDFNVSHSGDFVVLAAENCPVGIDVMKFEYSGGKSIGEFFRVMNRQFSPTEWNAIKSLGTEKLQLNMFMRNWCLKESYVKAVGTGIYSDLQTLSFMTKSAVQKGSVITDSCLYIDGELQNDWVFEETLLDDDHCVTVALKNSKLCNQKGSVKLFTFHSFDNLVACAVPLSEPDSHYYEAFASKQEKPN